jgi:hypothetical protein
VKCEKFCTISPNSMLAIMLLCCKSSKEDVNREREPQSLQHLHAFALEDLRLVLFYVLEGEMTEVHSLVAVQLNRIF